MILSWERNTNVDYPSFAVFFRFQEVVLNGSKLVRGVLSSCWITRSGGCERGLAAARAAAALDGAANKLYMEANDFESSSFQIETVLLYPFVRLCCSWLTGGFWAGIPLAKSVSGFQANTIHKFSFLSSTKRKEGKKTPNLFQSFHRSLLI